MAATIPTAKAISPPRAEKTCTSAAPPVLLGESEFALLALATAPVALAKAAPVSVAAVLLTFPAAGFVVASVFVAVAVATSSFPPAVIVTGKNPDMSVPPSMVVTAVGPLSLLSVMSVIEP